MLCNHPNVHYLILISVIHMFMVIPFNWLEIKILR